MPILVSTLHMQLSRCNCWTTKVLFCSVVLEHDWSASHLLIDSVACRSETCKVSLLISASLQLTSWVCLAQILKDCCMPSNSVLVIFTTSLWGLLASTFFCQTKGMATTIGCMAIVCNELSLCCCSLHLRLCLRLRLCLHTRRAPLHCDHIMNSYGPMSACNNDCITTIIATRVCQHHACLHCRWKEVAESHLAARLNSYVFHDHHDCAAFQHLCKALSITVPPITITRLDAPLHCIPDSQRPAMTSLLDVLRCTHKKIEHIVLSFIIDGVSLHAYAS